MLTSIRRPPLLAFLALAAGLAGALVLLALLDAAVLRPIPGVREPGDLFALDSPPLSYPSFADFRSETTEAGSGIVGFAAFAHRSFGFSSGDGAEELRTGVVVAGDYFGVLGVRAAAGRLLDADDDRPGAALVAVISRALWRDRFGGDPEVVGREIRLNGSTFHVVGVAGGAFRNLVRERAPDLWVTAHAWIENTPSTFAGRSLETRGWSWLRGFGRVAPGASIAAARARVELVAKRIVAAHANEVRDDFAEVSVARATQVAAGLPSESATRGASVALLLLVALLQVLAISSAAHLFLARGEARRQELATRLALGASRARITALLLAEPVGCAIAASVAALAVARWTLALLAGQTLPGGTRLGELGLSIDPALAAFGALLALAAGVAAGLLPARRLAADDPAKALAAVRTVSPGSTRVRRALTVAQVAISLILVAATALVSRGLLRATSIDTGYHGEGLGFVTLDAGLGRYTPERALAGYESALAAVEAFPEIEAASFVGALPLDSGVDTESFRIAGYRPGPDERLSAEISLVGPGALSVLGIDLVTGREFERADRAGGESVAVVSRRFAERYLAGRNPVGAELEIAGRTARVVGVAGEVQAHGPGLAQPPVVYLPLLQAADRSALWPQSIVYRARRSPGQALGSVSRAASGAMPGVPVVPVGSFDDLLAAALAPQRFGSALFATFSLIATLLAATGLFGLVAHAAVARTRELGLRAALGAAPARLVTLLVRSAFVPVLLGTAIGLAAALPLAFAVRGLMVGFESLDLGALALAVFAFALVAAAASLIPALRGARLDPVDALRTE